MRRAVHQRELGLGGDRLGRRAGDDAELGLGARQRDLDVEPGLPAVLQAVERAQAGIGDARGGGQRIAAWRAHWAASSS